MQIAEKIVSDLKERGYDRAVLVAHSYGTMVATRLLRRWPELIHNLVLLDPANMVLVAPDTLYNFIYHPPRRHSWEAWAKDIVRIIANRDPGLATTFCRKFFWHALNVWPDELPPGCVVCVAGQDALLPAHVIRRQIEQAGGHLTLLFCERSEHGDVCKNPVWLQKVTEAMRSWLPGPASG